MTTVTEEPPSRAPMSIPAPVRCATSHVEGFGLGVQVTAEATKNAGRSLSVTRTSPPVRPVPWFLTTIVYVTPVDLPPVIEAGLTPFVTRRSVPVVTVVSVEQVVSVESTPQLLPTTTTVFGRSVVPVGQPDEASFTENVYVFVAPAAIVWPLQVRSGHCRCRSWSPGSRRPCTS